MACSSLPDRKIFFTVSAKDFVSDMSVGGTLLSGEIAEKWSQPFSKITLTDEKASLEYLNKAPMYTRTPI